ncbi:hypothetical protein FB446DRAFT_707937 [Lentinula raphanica]|nr:hypothetical protein FB446DRAFT_707937 [Lentinula raphanica]
MVHFKYRVLTVVLASGLASVLSVPVSVPDGSGSVSQAVSDERQTTTGSGMAGVLSSHSSSSSQPIIVARTSYLESEVENRKEEAIVSYMNAQYPKTAQLEAEKSYSIEQAAAGLSPDIQEKVSQFRERIIRSGNEKTVIRLPLPSTKI